MICPTCRTADMPVVCWTDYQTRVHYCPTCGTINQGGITTAPAQAKSHAALLAEFSAIKAERDRLLEFKAWVHAYLTSRGVPYHPPGPHGAEGCRIGDRLDWLMAERDALRDAIGVCVPSCLRVLLNLLPGDADVDRDVTTKVLARVEKAMAAALGVQP